MMTSSQQSINPVCQGGALDQVDPMALEDLVALEDPVAHPHLAWDNQEVLAAPVDLEVGWDPVDQVVLEVPMGQVDPVDQERHP